MPLQATSGAASYDAFGGGAAVAPKYIEDFFQTWLRTGTSASATVTTGLNASVNKSLVWTKSRSTGTNHKLTDTVRGATKALSSNTTGAEVTDSQGLTAFSSTGYTIGTNTDYNNSGATYVDWQWLATPKFFDVVTYTGNGNQQVLSHNLGSSPGFIVVKATSTTGDWAVWHRSTTFKQGYLNTTADFTSAVSNFTTNAGTSTTFTVNGPPNGGILSDVGVTYIAYLFAHDAGGFGLTGTDNVISCGSYTGTGSTQQQITLGYEPQWVMIKRTDTANSWIMVDNMRGFFQAADNALCANNANAEAATVSVSGAMQPTATGFSLFNANSAVNASGGTYIYIAIRRGPMKVPTTGTSVFDSELSVGTTGQQVTTGFPVDLQLFAYRPGGGNNYAVDRLRGVSSDTTETDRTLALFTNTTGSESVSNVTRYWNNTGYQQPSFGNVANGYINWNFRRAPRFFDEGCYTGTGSAQNVTHNLAAVPELMIVKTRSNAEDWVVYSVTLGNTVKIVLNGSGTPSSSSPDWWNNTTPTSSVFTVGSAYETNRSGYTYVAYLFATCPGVSKVGSYTGTGTTQTINCGFTGGARFVLIRATSTTGDWYVWDSARGIVAGNDPYLALNSTAAEVTTTDWVDTASSGFELSNAGGNLANSNGVSYIFLAIA